MRLHKFILKRGLANEAIPGLGYIYRYKQLKENFSNIFD